MRFYYSKKIFRRQHLLLLFSILLHLIHFRLGKDQFLLDVYANNIILSWRSFFFFLRKKSKTILQFLCKFVCQWPSCYTQNSFWGVRSGGSGMMFPRKCPIPKTAEVHCGTRASPFSLTHNLIYSSCTLEQNPKSVTKTNPNQQSNNNKVLQTFFSQQ